MVNSSWICPLCSSALHLKDKTYTCDSGHAFDIAKSGYVNLLPVQHKKSKDPGDSKAMVQAREAFLASGSYSALAESLCRNIVELIEQHGQQSEAFSLFDAGCSHAYYSRFIQKHIREHFGAQRVRVSGIDISKTAIEKAAKSYKKDNKNENLDLSAGANFAVASTFNIPLEDNSQDFVLQVFAPSDAEQIRRVLKPNGRWCVVTPGAHHLKELKRFVYDEVNTHDEQFNVPEGFIFESRNALSFECSLNTSSMRENLLAMTPFYWRISDENRVRLLRSLERVSADFSIHMFMSDKWL
ncbi:putative RNA methyltransferase [Ningiella sp. W23]|uniref:putative RNA methyltransferase n=1 Tax=Ningiella sp. W23 TaxID=3023715 RepID=UPI003757BA47